MNALALTIDCGTTNTRVRLWRGDHRIAAAEAAVGVRDTAVSGSTRRLAEAVRDAIARALAAADVAPSAVQAALASGMITSNLGLYELPHLVAPIDARALADGMRSVELPEVFEAPIWFVPGVKNLGAAPEAQLMDRMDIMRGEEVEVVGALSIGEALPRPLLVVLPGSHTKFVLVDAEDRIAGSMTSLAGELFDVLTSHTIVAAGLERSETIDAVWFERGLEAGAALGLGRAAFGARLLDQFAGLSGASRASYLLGAVIAGDRNALRSSEALCIPKGTALLVLGRAPLQDAYARALAPVFGAPVVLETGPDLAARGVLQLARLRGLLSDD